MTDSNSAVLSLKSACLIPGLSEDFAQRLEAAVLDCHQRPALSKARKVKIEFSIWPDPEDADDVLISPVVTSTTPARSIMPIRARRTRRNQLQFDFNLDDYEQGYEGQT